MLHCFCRTHNDNTEGACAISISGYSIMVADSDTAVFRGSGSGSGFFLAGGIRVFFFLMSDPDSGKLHPDLQPIFAMALKFLRPRHTMFIALFFAIFWALYWFSTLIKGS